MALSDTDRATLLVRQGRLSEGEAALRQVLAGEPQNLAAARNLALALLSAGNYAEGARLYEQVRFHMPAPAGLSFPRWRGEPLAAKSVLVWPEQGLGDQIMFARFVPMLRECGCDVTLVCHPALERLFADLPARVLPTSGTISFPDPDVWLFSNSLLAATGATVESLPNAPYLRAEASNPRRGGIGIATRGNPAHANDALRSLPPEAAALLLAIPGAISLLPEHTGASDLAQTADIIAGLDLVVTVDTSIAHLAGAMGKPVWVLLSEVEPDWRWMRGRSDSPWYPSARLYRQDSPGDWTGVLARIERDLS